jgi:hypothetical protein
MFDTESSDSSWSSSVSGRDAGVKPAVETAPKRADILKQMRGHWYENEQGVLVTNYLSTEVICFPSDRYQLPEHQSMLEDKIHKAIDYATNLQDIAELNALQYLATTTEHRAPPHGVLTLGLYLYLADEASRRNTSKSFLTAMREAHAELAVGEGFEWNVLDGKAKKALEILQFGNAPNQCLDEWYDEKKTGTLGSFTVAGNKNCKDAEGHIHGAYAHLAEQILQMVPGNTKKDLEYGKGLSLAISYAVANRPKLQGKTEKEMLDFTRNVSEEEIKALVQAGIEERTKRIKKNITEQVPFPDQPKKTECMDQILKFLPDKALEVFYREGYSCAYSDAVSLYNCYPRDNVSGVSILNNYAARNVNSGIRDRHHGILFMCNGGRQNIPEVRANPGLRFECAGQTLAHEIMHIMIETLTQEKGYIEELKEAVGAVAKEMNMPDEKIPDALKQTLYTIPPFLLEKGEPDDAPRKPRTLQSAMNPEWGLYKGYAEECRWEEVVCNAYGLMCTEYGEGKFPGKNPFREELPGCASLKKLADIIRKDVEVAYDRCCQKHPLPVPQQSKI